MNHRFKVIVLFIVMLFSISRVFSDNLILKAQDRLSYLGWYSGPINGQSNSEFVESIKNLQRKANVPVTGKLDARTIEVMSLSSWVIRTDFQGRLKLLVSNETPNKESVKKVQQLLDTIGYDPGPIDGVLGTKTQSALKKWKSKSGIMVSGSWLSTVARNDANVSADKVRSAIQFVAETIMYVCVKATEEASHFGTIKITEKHPFSIVLKKRKPKAPINPAIIGYKNRTIAFLSHETYMDYEVIRIGADDGKNNSGPVWEQVNPDTRFYIKDGAYISFSGFGGLLGDSNVAGVEFISGGINTTSSISKLKFDDKTTCIVTFKHPKDPNSFIEKTYRYVNGSWILFTT
jgi:peptidoglycan hydrolase-like protein with peptidoglycan-binding domain